MTSPLEALVAQAQYAATLDLLALASSTGAFEQAFLVTEEASLAQAARSLAGALPAFRLTIEQGDPSRPFHFGETLRSVCRAHGLERVVYVGGGSLPLGTARELTDMALAASGQAPCVMSNNLYSADLLAFWPTSALGEIELPATDNNLAWLLHYRAGLPFAALPRSLSTEFDIDTPTDLATLWWYAHAPGEPRVGEHLSRVLERVPGELPLLARNMERAYEVMATRRAEVLVSGRVSSWVWRRLETNLPCQTRIFSEERGMQASGREARGEVRSLLGLYMDLAGIAGLVSALEQVCDAAFLDSRVLFAHRRINPSRADRFASDALLYGDISQEWVRDFTRAAAEASIPILLGGHSLISGGVWALSERVRLGASTGAG